VAVLLHGVADDAGVVGGQGRVGTDVLQITGTPERLAPGHEGIEGQEIDDVHQPVAVVDGTGQRQGAVGELRDRLLHRAAGEPVDGLVGSTHPSMIVPIGR
jgi:hypothetical protein